MTSRYYKIEPEFEPEVVYACYLPEFPDQQLVVYEIDKYKLGVSVPDRIVFLDGKVKKTEITFEDKSKYVYEISKSNSFLIHQLIREYLSGEKSWINNCRIKIDLKQEEYPRFLVTVNVRLPSGETDIHLYDYSEKALVIVGPGDLTKSHFVKLKQGKFYVQGVEVKGFLIAKSNKENVREVENIFGEFQHLCVENSSGSSTATYNHQPTVLGHKLPSVSAIKGNSQQSIGLKFLSLLSEIKVPYGEEKDILADNSIIYGDIDKVKSKVEDMECEIVATLICNEQNKCIYQIKFPEI